MFSGPSLPSHLAADVVRITDDLEDAFAASPRGHSLADALGMSDEFFARWASGALSARELVAWWRDRLQPLEVVDAHGG